ncbi:MULTISPECIES: histidine phosphatase family protein [unclassified Paracoccus (in: a-proteobacteria)]|uniref:histidine phosphatase family protein n=1 Tax=unclassified Paracoccus (in: a-proteobacteria) TaxID=2688777 RepID=UPI0016000334|nr:MULTISPECIES: histidine phosphatase family protein [unclassified Paracoccus (in: a-proteobacteria)]MBB1489972.1 histidine phosphatase family protein [Paracoccus sp. MC1854]MBB1496559.1 histidine phosphatase family protein [Paracoccus sp. MC1862]QQO43582.1 histidine phosphatase family protein [Paracoccus sp. MC1862]
MSLLVGLVRHGAHDDLGAWLSGRTRDVALNAMGREETLALARRLAGRGVAAITASPRRRTVETADILGAGLNLTPLLAPDLDEIDFGNWSGRRFADLDGDPDWNRWNAARATALTPGGETMAGAVARAMRHIDHLAGQGCGPVLCVSHCDVIRGVIAQVLGLSLDHLLRFEIAPASVSWLMAHGHGAGHVLTVNGPA